MNRREFITSTIVWALSLKLHPLLPEASVTPDKPTSAATLALIREGNRRFDLITRYWSQKLAEAVREAKDREIMEIFMKGKYLTKVPWRLDEKTPNT